MMRQYRLEGIGSLDNLILAEAEEPRPGPGQVLVRIRAASLNFRDLLVLRGRYGQVLPNLVPLSDGAGEIAALGECVDEWSIGDRVAPIFSPSWIAGEIRPMDRALTLGGSLPGILSDLVVVDRTALVRLPEHLSFEEGATLPCAAVTAWNALHGGRPVRAGDTVLVLGTGGVSLFALAIARAGGARVIATSSSDDKLARALALGASDVVNYTTHPAWQAEVLRLTGGEGVDHVVEVGGAGTLPRSLEAVRIGGAVHLIGVLTGGEIDPSLLIRKASTLRGVFVGSRRHFEEMNRALAMHRLHPVIDRIFSMDEVPAAYRHLAEARHMGKIVVRL